LPEAVSSPQFQSIKIPKIESDNLTVSAFREAMARTASDSASKS
jgi:hypothetical protein